MSERQDSRSFAEGQAREDEVAHRRQSLLNEGFSAEWVSRLSEFRPTLYDPNVIQEHLAGLQERGFTNPRKMIESLPQILGLAFENIDRKLEILRQVTELYNVRFQPSALMERLPFVQQ